MKDINVKMNRLSHDVKLNIRIQQTRRFRLRMWLGVRCLRLAAWIMGCDIEVSHEVDA